MSEKNTDELEKILLNTHAGNVDRYLTENRESLLSDDRAFSNYMKERFHEKKLSQQDIFLQADIPERYGYKLLSGEKKTRQRDIILRICYAAHFTLNETQQALRIYEMPQLYAKLPRDAALMICFNEHPGNILDVNALLKEQGMEMLRTSGAQE